MLVAYLSSLCAALFSRLTPPACTYKMDAEAFRKHGKEMVDYIADYLENIRDRRPLPSVKPGYLRKLIPGQAPEDPENWEDVFGDIERVIMPGVSVGLMWELLTIQLSPFVLIYSLIMFIGTYIVILYMYLLGTCNIIMIFIGVSFCVF